MTKQLGSEQASGVSSLGEELACCTLPAGPSRQSRKSRVRTGSSRVVSPQVVNSRRAGSTRTSSQYASAPSFCSPESIKDS